MLRTLSPTWKEKEESFGVIDMYEEFKQMHINSIMVIKKGICLYRVVSTEDYLPFHCTGITGLLKHEYQ